MSTPVYRYTVTPVQRHTGTLANWYTGTLLHRAHVYTDALVHMCNSTLVYRCSRIPTPRDTDLRVHQNVFYSNGLVHKYTGIPIHCHTGAEAHGYTNIPLTRTAIYWYIGIPQDTDTRDGIILVVIASEVGICNPANVVRDMFFSCHRHGTWETSPSSRSCVTARVRRNHEEQGRLSKRSCT